MQSSPYWFSRMCRSVQIVPHTRKQLAHCFDAVVSERIMIPTVPLVGLAQQQRPFLSFSLELGWSS